ncbi:MAG: hypothetical protein WCK86_09250 [Planctomycetia bacterium]
MRHGHRFLAAISWGTVVRTAGNSLSSLVKAQRRDVLAILSLRNRQIAAAHLEDSQAAAKFAIDNRAFRRQTAATDRMRHRRRDCCMVMLGTV